MTNDQKYGIYVSTNDHNIFNMAIIQGASVIIIGTSTWSGTTDINGYAKDTNGNSPFLPYGNYTVTASKVGYTPASQDFTVPLVGNINLTLTKIYQTVEIVVSD